MPKADARRSGEYMHISMTPYGVIGAERVNLSLYWYPWLTVCTIIPLNFNVCLGSFQTKVNLVAFYVHNH